MTVWLITGVLAIIVAMIVRAEVRCGRRTKDFFEVIAPEIDKLKSDSLARYRAKFGRDPTDRFALVDTPPDQPTRRRWFKR